VRRATERLEAVPGVTSAGSALGLPMSGMYTDLTLNIEGRPRGKRTMTETNSGARSRRIISVLWKCPCCAAGSSRSAIRPARRWCGDQRGHGEEVLAERGRLGRIMAIGKGLGPQFEEGSREVVGIIGNVPETGLADHGEGVMYVRRPRSPMA